MSNLRQMAGEQLFPRKKAQPQANQPSETCLNQQIIGTKGRDSGHENGINQFYITSQGFLEQILNQRMSAVNTAEAQPTYNYGIILRRKIQKLRP